MAKTFDTGPNTSDKDVSLGHEESNGVKRGVNSEQRIVNARDKPTEEHS